MDGEARPPLCREGNEVANQTSSWHFWEAARKACMGGRPKGVTLAAILEHRASLSSATTCMEETVSVIARCSAPTFIGTPIRRFEGNLAPT